MAIPTLINELERVAIHFSENVSHIRGYMMAGDEYHALPIGSTLDLESSTFSKYLFWPTPMDRHLSGLIK